MTALIGGAYNAAISPALVGYVCPVHLSILKWVVPLCRISGFWSLLHGATSSQEIPEDEFVYNGQMFLPCIVRTAGERPVPKIIIRGDN